MEVLINNLRTAQVRETQADHPKSVGDPMLVIRLEIRLEVVANGQAIVEHRHVLVQRLFVHLLLVQRPTLFVERQLVIGRLCTHGDDGCIRLFGIQIFLADEEIFATTKMNLINVLGERVLADQAIHDRHGLIRLTDLVVGA